MNNKGRRSNKSVCQKPIKMVANIVKLSSVSVAKAIIGTAPPSNEKFASFVGSTGAAKNSAPVSQFHGSQRAQEPMNSSNHVSYLIEPIQGDSLLVVIHEEKGVDGKASDYIRRVHEKNRHDCSEASTLAPYTLTPPPLVLK